MADFTSDLQNFRPSMSYLNNIDPNMAPFAEPNQQVIEDSPSTFNLHNLMPLTSQNNCLMNSLQTFQIPRDYWTENTPSGIVHSDQVPIVQPTFSANSELLQDCKKRARQADHLSAECSSGNSSPQVSQTGVKRKNSCGRGKKAKGNDQKEEDKPNDVVHVRARRGQATDSHSLAERVRRGKINERLRCLQDIVPGCYKTMGMAVMLDEIINYVQSLQNQVEFLSMKLTAASAYYDFNLETDEIETAHQRAKVNEAKEMDRIIREGYGRHANFNSTNWPF